MAIHGRWRWNRLFQIPNGGYFMRVPYMVLVFVISLQAVAQTAPASNLFDTQTTVTPRPQPAVSFAPAKETKPKVFDRKFFVLAGVAAAATAFDVTTTSRCMSTYVDCREGNPLLGAHPSTARLYGVSFSILGGQLLASAWLRRKTPNGKLWMALPIITAAGHGMAAVLNLRTMHQLRASQ
jgi:hypothetical protein